MFSRPFEVGDWIAVDGKEGIVTDITMMSTRIRGFDGEFVVVPNDVVGNEIIANRSRNGRLRTEVEVGVDYDVDVDRAREVATATTAELLAESDLSGSLPEVIVDRFGDSAVVLSVRVWVEDPTPHEINRIRGDVIDALQTRFRKEGIPIPYPQRELSSRADSRADVVSSPQETAGPASDSNSSSN